MMNEAEGSVEEALADMIRLIDCFHGNELKERSVRSINEEAAFIKDFLSNRPWIFERIKR